MKGLRALVVEDNELNMEIASFMLEDNGIIVDCAKDGLEAIGKFEKSEPGYYDVILMDIMMPNFKRLGYYPENSFHEKIRCRACTGYCHECQCICRKHYKQPDIWHG